MVPAAPPSIATLFGVALRLGCTSFGGPIAHIGFFRQEYVERRQWLSEAEFSELLALSQFLPGPSSSQLGFAIGYRLRGWAGGLAAWVAFTFPSAALMYAAALGAIAWTTGGHGWLQGLKVAAAAVVLQALLAMGRSLCPDRARLAIAAAALVVLSLAGAAEWQIVVIALGMAAGGVWGKSWVGGADLSVARRDSHWASGLGILALVVALLFFLPLAADWGRGWWLASEFYRAGALVFGGGHVVLPLLERGVVSEGAVTSGQFLAGYGLVQAVPGPLFSFSAYLGALAGGEEWWQRLGGSSIALVALFLPGLLLIPAVLPLWSAWRANRRVAAAAAGANAAVVGVLAAAFYDPVVRTAVINGPTFALLMVAFALLQWWKAPPWAVVLGCAAIGGLADLVK